MVNHTYNYKRNARYLAMLALQTFFVIAYSIHIKQRNAGGLYHAPVFVCLLRDYSGTQERYIRLRVTHYIRRRTFPGIYETLLSTKTKQAIDTYSQGYPVHRS